MQRRAVAALGGEPKWLAALCRRTHKRLAPAPHELAPLLELLANDATLRMALAKLSKRGESLTVRRWFHQSDRMVAVEGAPAHFGVPPIATEAELAAFFGIGLDVLPWFADLRRINAARSEQRLRHYRYRWVHKPSGGLRLLETPKTRLKAIQRLLLRDVLALCPADVAAHGFVPRRSVKSFAAPHVGRRVVLRLDLEDFFVSVRAARVTAIFRRLGYPEPVARALTGLCCTPTPDDIIAEARPELDFHAAMRLRTSHLAQGAPTSPALSNLACFRLDRRLRALARSAGAAYSRYADDLAFSGDGAFERGLDRFIVTASAIVLEEGFRVRHRKTRVMRVGGRQQLSGLVLNERLNVRRADYDALRALLHNAINHGPEGQNRSGHADFRAHLLGKIAWVAATNPRRGEKLHRAFALIDWSSEQVT